MRTWVNGRMIDETEAVVSVFDHGLTVGDGVFETVKVIDGVPFALRRHLERLARSAAGLELRPPDPDLARAACESVVAQAPIGRYRLRITYTGGIAPLGSGRGDGEQTLIVAIAPMGTWPGTTTVAVAPWPRNERGALTGLKTTSYGENVVALAHARRLGAAESLFADTQGRLSEGTGSNVFVVRDGRMLTPALSSGCLAGVTRALLLEWTGAEEDDLPIEVLDDADEVFLASTTRDVQAVSGVARDGGFRTIAEVPGPTTREAAAVFAQRSLEDPEP
ncbi:MAG TPA: aminotransferase class IV [Jiangellaceae bacterium]|nr:aminotransferase class IV [Jiangellaceae bacterium]